MKTTMLAAGLVALSFGAFAQATPPRASTAQPSAATSSSSTSTSTSTSPSAGDNLTGPACKFNREGKWVCPAATK